VLAPSREIRRATKPPLSARRLGKHYNYFRDYDPSIGRYIESDPLGIEAGLDTFVYVGAGPLSWADPFGLARFNVGEMRGMISRNNFSGYSDNLVLCVAWNESNFDPFRVSGTGPRGLMMVGRDAVTDLRRRGLPYDQNSVDVDPEQNIGAGTAYLGMMRRRWRGQTQALQHYGSGRSYPTRAILSCEKCLDQQTSCSSNPQRCLERIHK
jgi:RHS repeat-associated protein